MFKSNNMKYINSINAKGIFDNSYEQRMGQTVIFKAILNHFDKSVKRPKCLFIGWDGCRADAMKYIIKSEVSSISGCNDTNPCGAVSLLKSSGGLYITYVGGDKGSEQETSTAQGWASALCGKWMKKPWRQGIEWCLDSDYPTVLRLLSLKGYKTSFGAQWPIHFDNTYLKEIQLAQEEKLAQYFYKFETDAELYNHFVERIQSNDDFIFGIFENPDYNGHNTGFGDRNYRYVSGVYNLDCLSYNLLKEIKKRATFNEEDWLVLIASDHGGHSIRHGTQKTEDRTTFLAISKPIEELIK